MPALLPTIVRHSHKALYKGRFQYFHSLSISAAAMLFLKTERSLSMRFIVLAFKHMFVSLFLLSF